MQRAIKMLGMQIREIWKRIGVNQKISIVMALVICAGTLAALLYWSARPQFRLLYAGLSLKDASAMREKLEDERIRVQLRDSGSAIYVPASDVYGARLLLAGEGLPKDAATGFELFEEPRFGLTDFAQQVNYQRALQGELERTITAMQGVASARVMLVLPKEKLFASEEEKAARASIMLTLGPGASISTVRVRSIAHLVASAVPGLSASAITVVDHEGRLLSAPTAAETGDMMPAEDQLGAQHKIESALAQKAQDILNNALGPGRSIVRVSSDIDFSRIERSSEKYDGDVKLPRVERVLTETTSTPGPGVGGVAGVRKNTPVSSPQSSWYDDAVAKSKKEDLETEYVYPHAVERVLERGARIKRLSVSVCVAEGAGPRSDAEKKAIEDMVSSAVGLVKDPRSGRVDVITVTEMPFPGVPAHAPLPWWRDLPVSVDSLVRGLLVALLLLLLYVASRRMVSSATVRGTDVGIPVEALTGEPSRTGLGPVPVQSRAVVRHGEEIPMDLVEVMTAVKEDPKTAAAWIKNLMGAGG